jgi:leucyl aminopeptidase
VLFVAAAAENAIDALAYKPHAILRSHKGLTVEIGNTDAEGRLVLADALSFAQSRHRPHTVVDMATLTGACIVGLGEYTAGLFTNNKALREGLVAAGEGRGERLWPMPILPEHRDELTGGTPFADLKSTGEGRYGGACTAAAFLENFLGPDPAKNAREGAAAADEKAPFKPAWAHIDLAGPAMYSRDRGFMKKGGTGFGVHAVVSYLLAAPAGALPADA